MSDEQKIIWLVELNYGQPAIMKLYIERETPKMYFIARKEKVLNYIYLSGRIRKDSPKIKETPQEAFFWLMEKLKVYVKAMSEKVEKSKEWMKVLEDLKKECGW